MWYLILPPIITIACFVAVVWYLSLRGAHPEVALKVEKANDEQIHSFRSAFRRFTLRVLEKLAQRSKVLALRLHNAFHELLQVIKEKRKNSGSQPIAVDHSVLGDEQSVSAEITESFGRDETIATTNRSTDIIDAKPTAFVSEPTAVATSFSIDTPLKRRGNREEELSQVIEPLVAVRPMVSEQVARPEKSRRKVFTSRPIEEDLISRIATNPKDYTAYEALGDFYMNKGSVQDAKECYKQVLKLSPVQRMVKIKIRRLERLLSQK
mgnify:CR=1 FL=1